MLVIYIDRQTNRLGYTINLIFRQMLKTDYIITTSRDQFIALKGAKLSYCSESIIDEVHIPSSDLLFETNISALDIDYVFEDGIPKIFRSYGQGDALGFDVFAAVFYMVSRYEEYLPFIRDGHSRFCATDSIAYQKGFYDKPVVNIWVEFLKDKLLGKYPFLEFEERKFSFENTIDVDMAYSYKGKDIYRTAGGFLRDMKNGDFHLCYERIKVLCGIKKDPYDCFDYIVSTICSNKLRSVFFFLLGMRSEYDKNISPYNYSFQMLIKNISDIASVGIHPSYYSMENPQEMTSQIKHLSSVIHKSVTSSRFHFLRFNLPSSYRDLVTNGITDDYSMGYSDEIGFRAGICVPYNFYDLEKDCETKLRIHPFMFMDVVLKNKMQLSPEDAWIKIREMIDRVREVKGEFTGIWHNESLSSTGQWQGWREVYGQEIKYIKDIMNKK